MTPGPHRSPTSLSLPEARALALAAQGFGRGRTRSLDDVMGHLHVLQIDSVNVFSRSHYMPAFSRLGAYSHDTLDQRLWRDDDFTEYWAHEAAFIPVADRHLFAWRMHDFRERFHTRGRLDSLAASADFVRERLTAEGPLLVNELEPQGRANRGEWWDWSETKQAVEMLFATGEVVSAGRERFMRRYALASEQLPAHALAETPRDDAQAALVEIASRALGVGTLADLADYHRLPLKDARAAVARLEAEGTLVPATVDGWIDSRDKPIAAWMHRDTQPVGRIAPDALLTPFDPLSWFRPRAERLFDFHYRIEIYTPKEKRQYGYYCLPLMVGGRLAGRIDLKADRARSTLMVQAAWQEPRAPKRTPEAAVTLLRRAAAWQGLEHVEFTGVGNLPLAL